jgi:ATP-dependent exoDNAse (exonuclease V) beta subunit
VDLLLESRWLGGLLDRAAALDRSGTPLLALLGRVRGELSLDPSTDVAHAELATALLVWAVGHPTLADLTTVIRTAQARLADLRRDDAALTLATAHATKGLEFDHVVVVGMEAGRFPSGRTVAEAEHPGRAYEEERRLAYVAWTRARRTLTLLYDPAVPSPFLLEAFSPAELGLSPAPGGAPG